MTTSNHIFKTSINEYDIQYEFFLTIEYKKVYYYLVDTYKNKLQIGEISAIITVFSIVVMFVGLILGISNSSKTQKIIPRADQTGCLMHTEAVVVTDESQNILLTQDQNQTITWGVTNNKPNIISPEGEFGFQKINGATSLVRPNQAFYLYHNDNYKFLGEGGDYTKGEKTSVKLIGLNTQKWKVTKAFCNNLSTDPNAPKCPSSIEMIDPTDPLTLKNFTIDCGVNNRYGWVVEPVVPSPTATPTITPTGNPQPSVTNTPTPITEECTISTKYIVKNENGVILNTNQFTNPNQWGIINNKQNESQKINFTGTQAEKTVDQSASQGTLKFKCPTNLSGPKCDPNALFEEGEKATIKLLTDDTYSVIKKSITRCGDKNTPSDYQCDYRDPIVAGASNEIPGVPIKCNMNYVFEYYVKKNACTYNAKIILKDVNGNILTQDKMIKSDIKIIEGRASLADYPWGISNNKQDQTKPSNLFDKENAEINISANNITFLPNDPNAKYLYGEKSSIKLFHHPGFEVINWKINRCGIHALDFQCDKQSGPLPGKNPDVIDGIPIKCNMDYVFEYQLALKTCNPNIYDISYGSCGGTCASNQRPRFVCKNGVKVADNSNRCETVPNCPLTTTPPTTKCQKIKGDGKYKLVFVPQGFTDYNEYMRYVQSAIDWVYKTNLTPDQTSHFSFYVNSTLTQNNYYDVERNNWTNYGDLIKQGRDCDSTTSILLIKNPIPKAISFGSENILVTSSILEFGAPVLSHELGHNFGQLDDEYIYPQNVDWDIKANCTNRDDSSCSKWRDRVYYGQIQCSLGCRNNDHFRSTPNSIMRDNFTNTIFNQVSIDEWNRQITIYRNKLEAYAYSLLYSNSYAYHNAIKLTFKHDAINNLRLIDASIQQTYPDQFQKRDSNFYTLRVKDAGGTQIYSYDIDTTQTQIVESINSDGTIKGQGSTILTDNIIVYIPYFKNQHTVQIVNKQNQQVFLAKISDLNLTSPQENQNLCGNGICDFRNQESANSCALDCRGIPTPTATPPTSRYACRTTDSNNDGATNTLDYAYLIKRYRQNNDILKADLNCDGRVNAGDASILLEVLRRRSN